MIEIIAKEIKISTKLCTYHVADLTVIKSPVRAGTPISTLALVWTLSNFRNLFLKQSLDTASKLFNIILLEV